MKRITIKRLFEDEWEQYKNTRLHALSDSPEAFGSTFEVENSFTPKKWKQRLARMDCITLVALSKEEVGHGLIVGAPYDGQAGIFSMWVDPNYRGQGLGTKLIQNVVDWAKENKKEQILLDVGDENIPAIKLYYRNGFEPNGIVGSLPPPRENIKEHQRVKKLK